MHTPLKHFTILTVIAQLPQLSLSTWTPGKAAQINFYVGGTCTAYSNEAAFWWTSSPLVGGSGAITGAECFLLGVNTAMMWEESTASDTVEPDQANGWCMFWDRSDCTGNQVSSVYAPAGDEGGPCQPARNEDGFLWKSGRCFIDATTTPAPPRISALTSTPNTTPTSPSTTSLSTSIGHTSLTSSSSTSLSAPTSSHTSTTISSSASPPGYSSSISESLESASTPPQSKTRTTKRKLPLLRYDRRRHSWCCFTSCSRRPTCLLYLASRTKETRGDPPIPACVGTTRTEGTARIPGAFRIKRKRGWHGA
ncbi:hypothetical protein C8J57DRAFT_1330335 [Mycena rebaudengoi]|nr:hypothetical protein C8J57DRAFT_1330335 [Mycena rebaudengoi]